LWGAASVLARTAAVEDSIEAGPPLGPVDGQLVSATGLPVDARGPVRDELAREVTD
jgi:hypothetical protein